MNREYYKGYSSELQRDMEMLIFGYAGTPLVVFPTSMEKFFEYEDQNMVGILASRSMLASCKFSAPMRPILKAGTTKAFILERVCCGTYGMSGISCMKCFPSCAGRIMRLGWR